ncbi:tetratricopeptide repeat protein [Microcoleus sp. F8-D3]
MQNHFTRTASVAIALLTCHGCALVPAIVSASNETTSSGFDSLTTPTPDCLGSLPKVPTRKGESSKNVEIEADLLGVLGEGQEALKKYSEARALYIEELGRGIIGLGQGSISAAMEVNHSLDTPKFLRKLGIAFAQVGQHQVAIGCYTEALNEGIEAPDNANVYMSRGNSYAQIGAGENARQDYQKSADLFEKYELPQDRQIALNKLNQTPNKNKLGVVIPTPQPPTVDASYKKTCYADALIESEGREITEKSSTLEVAADKLAAAGKHKEAIRKYNKAGAAIMNESIADGTLENLDASAIWHSWRGEGVEGFKKENQVFLQKTAEVSFKVGSSYARLEQYEQAIDCFNGTLNFGILPPNDAIAYLNRGDAYERMGDKAKAKVDFQQAATLFKKYKQPTYQKMSEQRLQAVVK